MQVACYHGQHDMRVEEVEMPETGPDEVRAKIEAAGVCGTDLHEYEVSSAGRDRSEHQLIDIPTTVSGFSVSFEPKY